MGFKSLVGIPEHENEETTTRGQAWKGDRLREGRLWEIRELMDKNRIEGRHGASRWHNTPKTIGMPVEVNPAAVRRSNVQLPGEICSGKMGQKSADAIVVAEMSRGLEDARLNIDTGGLPPFLSGHAILHFPPPENGEGSHSPDEGQNQ